jgi:hypothetical protein
VSYVIWPLSGVDEGWITLDNPTVARETDGGEPRYYHTNYRLVKALSKAYAVQTDASGNWVLDPQTRLPLLAPLSISVKTGWNQFGNIFFNWTKATQTGPVVAAAGSPALVRVIPTQPNVLGQVRGVYANAQRTGANYYMPGVAATPYRRGDAYISLTTAMPTGTAVAYIKYEAYPREDVGIPIGEVTVRYLGQTKTLTAAKTAGWISDVAWRYDAEDRGYVRVHATAAGAETTLKAWSGQWIRAYVNCELIIDPNTAYNGATATVLSSFANETASRETLDMPPPPPE